MRREHHRTQFTTSQGNLQEQDHRFVKKKIAASLWSRSVDGALRTIESCRNPFRNRRRGRTSFRLLRFTPDQHLVDLNESTLGGPMRIALFLVLATSGYAANNYASQLGYRFEQVESTQEYVA